MKKGVAIAAIWLACGLFNRGYILGGFTAEFPAYRHDIAATAFALGGPFMLPEGIYAAASGAPYMWRGYSCQQRWDNWDAKLLGKSWFVGRDGNWDCRNWSPE